jgi:hypothetical protein
MNKASNIQKAGVAIVVILGLVMAHYYLGMTWMARSFENIWILAGSIF